MRTWYKTIAFRVIIIMCTGAATRYGKSEFGQIFGLRVIFSGNISPQCSRDEMHEKGKHMGVEKSKNGMYLVCLDLQISRSDQDS